MVASSEGWVYSKGTFRNDSKCAFRNRQGSRVEGRGSSVECRGSRVEGRGFAFLKRALCCPRFPLPASRFPLPASRFPPPALPRPRKVSDDDVFAAAYRVMQRVGPADLTLDAIAREAGVTAGAL